MEGMSDVWASQLPLDSPFGQLMHLIFPVCKHIDSDIPFKAPYNQPPGGRDIALGLYWENGKGNGNYCNM